MSVDIYVATCSCLQISVIAYKWCRYLRCQQSSIVDIIDSIHDRDSILERVKNLSVDSYVATCMCLQISVIAYKWCRYLRCQQSVIKGFQLTDVKLDICKLNSNVDIIDIYSSLQISMMSTLLFNLQMSSLTSVSRNPLITDCQQRRYLHLCMLLNLQMLHTTSVS